MAEHNQTENNFGNFFYNSGHLQFHKESLKLND